MTEQQFDNRRAELGRSLRPVGGVSLVASVLIGLVVVTQVIGAWSEWDAVAAGGYPPDTEPRFAVTTVGFALAPVVAAIVFLMWLWSARDNAELLCSARHRRSRTWLTLGWICPIVNLWFPYQIVADIYRASRPDNPRDLSDLRSVRGSPLLGWWWALWLAAEVPTWILLFVWTPEVTADSLRTSAIAYTATTAMTAGAAVLVIMIMRRISFWQSPG